MGVLLGMSPEELLYELRFLHSDGTQYGGADAVLVVARQIWWVQPLVWLSYVPGMKPLLRSAYRWVAARRRCSALHCDPVSHKGTPAAKGAL